jgi:hypothetical protein
MKELCNKMRFAHINHIVGPHVLDWGALQCGYNKSGGSLLPLSDLFVLFFFEKSKKKKVRREN